MKNCKNCGKVLPDDSFFCVECGKKYEESPAPVQVEAEMPAESVPTQTLKPEQQVETSQQPTPKKSKKGLIFGLIGGGVGLLILLAAALWFFTRPAISWRMTPNKADTAISKEFQDVLFDSQSGDEEQQTREYTAYHKELGRVHIGLHYTFDKLTSITLHTSVSVEALRNYMEKELGPHTQPYDFYSYLCVEDDTYSYIYESYKDDYTSTVSLADLSAWSFYDEESMRRQYETAR